MSEVGALLKDANYEIIPQQSYDEASGAFVISATDDSYSRKALIKDANREIIPQQYYDAESGVYKVVANGDTTGVDFSRKTLLKDANNEIIPQQYYDVNSGQFVLGKVTSGGDGGSSGDISVKTTSKLNVTAPYAHMITLNAPLKLEGIATTVLQYVNSDVGIVQYNADYNNAEASSFVYDSNVVSFDGYMNIRDRWTYGVTEIEADTYYESDEIDFAEFMSIGSDLTLNIDGLSATIDGLKSTSAIVKANGDISIEGVESLDSINWTTVTGLNGVSKLAISFDKGATYKAWNGTQWVNVDVNSLANFKTDGMSKAIVDGLTDAELSIARKGSNFIRFAYYLERPTYDDVAKNDRIQLFVTMQGRNEIAPTSAYDYTYDEVRGTLSYNFTASGTYQINYVDAS